MRDLLKYTLTGLLFVFSAQVFSQNKEINQYDDNGERHGIWKKYFENSKQLRYEGEFVHGKEKGVFKFYTPDSEDQPQATKTYSSKTDSVTVKYYDKKGNLTSEGKMIGKSREGKWTYYHQENPDQIMMTETYANDKLHGWKKVYFRNGKPTEKTYYEDGVKNGEKFVYGENGQLIQYYNYKKDRLHGPSEVYDGNGNLLSEGAYKNGLRRGTWKFHEDDKKDSTKTY